MSNQLTFYEREKLEWLLKLKSQSIRAVSKVMRRDHSVIVREINRNSSGRQKYKAKVAQKLNNKRIHKKHIGKIEKCPELKKYIEEMILDDWSPEEIAGTLREEPPEGLNGVTVSHESIYYYIYEKADKHKRLYKHLRTHRPKRYHHGKRKSKKVTIPSRVSIHDRPKVVEKKKRYGDWESDSMIFSKQKYCLSVQYERKSMLVRICKVDNKSADETYRALVQSIDSLPQYMFKTMTFDNGTEGVRHIDISREYDVKTFFCDPYCSWQKGGVENINKLIRQYLPRNIDLSKFSNKDIYNIQEKLNNRPRKSLNYKTPNQVIHKVVH